MIKTILFDMDGTILPMDEKKFTETYFRELTLKMAPFGYDPDELVAAVWKGTAAMVKNDGSRTNEQAFWQTFAAVYGEKAQADKPVFDEFYRVEFNNARHCCGFDPRAGRLARRLKDAGYRLILASNPIFPRTAQLNRMEWAGVDSSLFDHITCYENSGFCKPNPNYYLEIVRKAGLDPSQCLMIGNDMTEDIPARDAGMDVFIVTPCLINRNGGNVSEYPNGDLGDAEKYIFG